MAGQQDLRIDFWDVGQGNASVLTLPNNELIIIDVGPLASPLVDWLAQFRNCVIRAIVLTHNHDDHVGALPSIIKMIPSLSIKTVYMLEGPEHGGETFRWILRPVHEAWKRKEVQVFSLTAGQEIWSDQSLNVKLRVVFPSFLANLNAKSQNQTSGIIVLDVHDEVLIIWPGDALLRDIAETAGGGAPYIIDGPHHGAPEDVRATAKHEVFTGLVKTINAHRCHISVGTINGHQHPRPHYLKRLVHGRCHVTCTQLTAKCYPDVKVNETKPIIQTHALLGLRPPRQGITCRGPLRLTLTAGKLIPDKWDSEHRRRVKERIWNPLCMSGSESMPKLSATQ